MLSRSVHDVMKGCNEFAAQDRIFFHSLGVFRHTEDTYLALFGSAPPPESSCLLLMERMVIRPLRLNQNRLRDVNQNSELNEA